MRRSGSGSNTNPCLEEALRLARGGYHVGITSPLKKRPHPQLMAKCEGSKGGVWRAATDQVVVRTWWKDCPTGCALVSPRGCLIAIDIDDVARFKAEVGEQLLEHLLATFPATHTPSGGLHIWMMLPEAVKLSSAMRKLSFGETIYEGFYALVAPSCATAKSGEERCYESIQPLPDRIEDVPVVEEHVLDQLILVGAEPDREIVDGERHNALLRLGIDLGRKGFSPEEIMTRLRDLNETFIPPYRGQEARSEIKGVADWVRDSIINGESSNTPVSSIQFISMAELANRPAPRWLIPNLIPDGGLGFLIGRPAAGKSFFLQELAQSVCRGMPLFSDPELTPNREGWVLCLLPEAAPSWAVRTRTYCEYHGVDFNDRFVCCIQPLDLGNQDLWDQLWSAASAETERRGSAPALVIVDTLSSAIPGRDENSQSDMTPLMSHLQEFVTMGSAVIVAHHPAKYSTTYRGSSVLHGSCDWMISVIKVAGGLREFKSEKLRDVEQINPTAFVIQKHGESAVCVKATTKGPWGLLRSYSEDHPGLQEALLHHGLEIPGEIQRKAKDGDITSEEGVSLKQVKETWRRFDPVRPAHRVDPVGYKAADRERTTALLAVVGTMVDSGVLEPLTGKVSKSTRKLDAVVRQVFTDEDA